MGLKTEYSLPVAVAFVYMKNLMPNFRYITLHDMKLKYNIVKDNRIQYITVKYFILEYIYNMIKSKLILYN